MTLTPEQVSNLAGLSRLWLAAKKEEAAANTRRVALETQIIAITGEKTEGSATTEINEYEIKITAKLTRKLDLVKFDAIKDQVPPELHPVKVGPRTLDETGAKWLQQHNPDVYAILSPAIEVKKAKLAVEIKVVEVTE